MIDNKTFIPSDSTGHTFRTQLMIEDLFSKNLLLACGRSTKRMKENIKAVLTDQ